MIDTFLDEAKLPFRTLEQKVFDAAVDYVFRNFPKWGREVNATLAALNALAAGGVYAFPYVFDSSTVDGDPGVGKLRLSNATQTGAATLRMDVQIFGGVDISNVFADLRTATSSVKGSVRLVKTTDPSKWAIFDVSAVALPVGYRNLSVVARASSSVNPFTNGDPLMVFIERNGDSGTVPGATELLATIQVASATSQINALSVFDTSHDLYLLDIDYLSLSPVVNPYLLLAFNGGAGVGNVPYAAVTPNGAVSASASTYFSLGHPGGVSGTTRLCGQIWIGSVNNSSLKSIMYTGHTIGQGSNPRGYANYGGGAAATAPATGFAIGTSDSGNAISSALIRVYGVRKQ